MSPIVSRTLAVAGAAAGAVALLLAAVHLRGAAITRSVDDGGGWYSRTPAWFASRGLYTPERTADGGVFAWANGRVRVQVPRLDRSVAYRLRIHARTGRSLSDPPTRLRLLVDRVEVAPIDLTVEWQDIDVVIPVGKGLGASLSLETDQTFLAPQDRRTLAFLIDRLTLSRSDGRPIAPDREVFVRVALFAAAVAFVFIVCSLPASVALGAGLAAGAAASALLLFDSAFLSTYSSIFAELGIVTVVLGAVVNGSVRFAVADSSMSRAWSAAALLAIVVTCVRLAVFAHPAAPIGDAMFHVHRAEEVRVGHYLFTSVTPKPFYEFPYPIGLYVAAQPLWDRFTDRVFMFRLVALVTDGVVAVGLFAVVAARWGSRQAGVLATVFALTVPVVTQTIATANLTNAFAQSCFSLALLWIGWCLPSTRWVVAAIGTIVLLNAGYLSHFSTAVIGMPVAVLAAGLVSLARDRQEARAWRWLMVSVFLALALSYVVYYSHFHEVYARTLSRIGTEKAETSLVATLAEHSESKPVTMVRFFLYNYGWSALLLAGVGTLAALIRGWREGWTLVLTALALIVLAFVALGAFTPIEMRANLAAHPLVAALAALGTAWLWSTGRLPFRILACAGVLWSVWTGIAALREVLG